MTIEILNPNGSTVSPDCTSQPTLKQMQTWVGGYIEAVPTPFIGLQVYADEEGRIKELPYNLEASALFGCDLYGPVVLLTEEHQLT